MIIGDSIVKHIKVNLLCPDEECLLICKPGARINLIRYELTKLATEYDVEHLFIVVGANHSTEHSALMVSKIKSLLTGAKDLFIDSKIHYSGYLPKYNESFLPFVNDVNNRLKRFCHAIGVDLVYNSQFIVNGAINWSLMARDGLHLSRKGVGQLASNFKYPIRKFVPRTSSSWTLGPGIDRSARRSVSAGNGDEDLIQMSEGDTASMESIQYFSTNHWVN